MSKKSVSLSPGELPQKKNFNYYYERFSILFWTALCLLPLYWMLVLPWKTWDDAVNSPFALPTTFTLDNFSKVLKLQPLFEGLLNSLIYSVSISVSAVVLGCAAAYALTRMRKKTAPYIDKFFKLGLVMPTMCLVSATFLMLSKMGLIGTVWAVILPTVAVMQCSTVLSFGVWFMTCPSEYEEAAVIDGVNPLQLFFKIMLPQIAPGLLTTTTIFFITIWNNYESFKVYAMGKAPQPVTMMVAKLFTITKTQDWGLIGAGILISSIPSIIAYCFFNGFLQRAYTGDSSLK